MRSSRQRRFDLITITNDERIIMTSLLHPPEIRTDRFTWSGDDLMFVSEASDLADTERGQVYDDAIDMGFTLVSARTGREVVMVEHHHERDADGDVLWTDYIPADQVNTVARGAHPRYTVRVFND